MTQYPIAILDRAELQRYLNATEVDRLTDADMHKIATAMQEELNDLGFWEFMALVARRILAEKETANGRAS